MCECKSPEEEKQAAEIEVKKGDHVVSVASKTRDGRECGEGGTVYTIKGAQGYGMGVGLYFESNGRPQSDFI